MVANDGLSLDKPRNLGQLLAKTKIGLLMVVLQQGEVTSGCRWLLWWKGRPKMALHDGALTIFGGGREVQGREWFSQMVFWPKVAFGQAGCY